MRDFHRYNGGCQGAEWQNRIAPEIFYFTFSAVRNPFDRLISAWRYLPRLRALSLEDVLQDLPMCGHDYRHITMTQTEMLIDPKSGKILVDDLIRYESLQQDFDRICDRLGKPRQILSRLLPGDRILDYRRYFSRNVRALVEERFREDLENFGYSF